MFKKLWFWVVFFIISVSAIFYVAHKFPQVMSFISIDITMNREDALNETDNLAQKFGWGTEDFRQVAVFSEDGGQTYIELEGGGKSAFNELLKSDFFSYYFWKVRNYKPGELLDSFVYFKPTGEPYGFKVNYPEDYELPNISMDEALLLAKSEAEKDWGIDFSKYDINDKKMITNPNGRQDYSFVFVRNDQKINEAEFRLNLKVTGDKFSELTHHLKTPEAFSRRYREMRSANNTIAGIGSIFMIIFYGILGIIFGSLFLIKNRWLLWKKALFWAIFVASLEFIASFNYLSLSWINYQTTSSVAEHILSNVANSISGFVSNVILLSISFMVGESLTRKAFGKKTQLWKTWSGGVANSKEILGNTLGAYLWVPLALTYILVFYSITTKYFGWWNSSSLSIDPNTLATPFPWLSAISRALHAGFWEECLFRAVPLAGAILIGRKLNKEKLFFWIGMILQIIIFGMGHANYPAQPSYARVIELIIPSIMFAVAYLRFGLLTGIYIHFVFDAVLMSLPIWSVQPKEMLGNKILFILSLSIPFLIILFRFLKDKKFVEIPEEARNHSWKPKSTVGIIENSQIKNDKKLNSKAVYILGIVGIIFSILLFHSPFDGKKLEIDQQDAIELTKDFLKSQNIEDIDEFEILVDTQISNVPTYDLYWQRLGKEKFNQLADDFIPMNILQTRVVKFDGDLQERAEEFKLRFAKNGEMLFYSHNYHEEIPGDFLEDAQALQVAKDFMKNLYNVNSEELVLMKALPEKKNNRRDWSFTFKDTINYKLGDDEINYVVELAGSELKRIYKNIKVPEKITEEFYSDFQTRYSLRNLTNIFNILLIVVSMVIFIIAWTKKEINMKVFFIVLSATFLLMIINLFLNLQDLVFSFSTAEPYGNQLIVKLLLRVLLALGISIFVAITLGYFANYSKEKTNLKTILIAFVPLGFFFLLYSLLPQLRPHYLISDAIVSKLPIFSAIYFGLKAFFMTIILIVPTYIVFDKITSTFTKRNLLVILWLFFLILSITMKSTLISLEAAQIFTWIGISIISTLFFFYVIKKFVVFNPQSLIWLAGFVAILKSISIAISNGYPNAMLFNFIAAIIVLVTVILLDKLMAK